MKVTEISPQEVPADFQEFRSVSPEVRLYLESEGLMTFPIKEGLSGWINTFFKNFWVVNFGKTDVVPDISTLKPLGFRHGLLIWSPWRGVEAPQGWGRMPRLLESFATGFSVLDRPEYWKKWSERGRRARRQFLSHGEVEIRKVSTDTFYNAYKDSGQKKKYKRPFAEYYRKMGEHASTALHSYVAYRGEEVLAGLAVLDYGGNSSVHLVAFTNDAGKPLQAGTGLMDRWFKDAQERGLKYLSCDHLRGGWWNPRTQAGYTEFKKNFMDFYFVIPYGYWKWC